MASESRPAGVSTEIVLDLSRLLSRVRHATPTGVDRVELAYARGLLARVPERLSFGAVHPVGVYGRLDRAATLRFLEKIEGDWHRGYAVEDTRRGAVRDIARPLMALRPRPIPRAQGPRIVLQSSPHHLVEEPLVRAILRREGARYACLVHDLIPIDYPEYARPGGKDLHLRRMRTVARLADVAIANSEATRRSFLPYIREAGRDIAVHVAHLGLDLPPGTPRTSESAPPYFVCVGTIEPRKNHLLLLHIWRHLAETLGGANIPKLIVIGRRGWENEQVIDMLERCTALKDCVEERSGLSDAAMTEAVAGARALLLPSFAEGYGMPVPEALAMGVPVICSDLPALREAGGDGPDYLDPLDGPGWIEAILDYASPTSSGRARQLGRLRGWTAPTWPDHINRVLDALQSVTI